MSGSDLRIGAKELAGQLIDTHTHCGGMDLSNFYKGRYPSSQDILDLDEKRHSADVGYQIVFPMPTSLYYDIPAYWKDHVFVPSGYSAHPFQLENQYLFSQIKHFHLERMLPFAAISLQAKAAEQEADILRLAEQYPLYGLKHHTKVDQKSADKLDQESGFVELARQLNVPVIFHTEQKGCSGAMAVLELAARHPDVRFCAAHMGGLSAEFCRGLDGYPYDNIYVDTCPLLPRCASVSKNRSPQLLELDYENPQTVLRYFVERYPGRMLWGTDAPWTNYGLLEEPKHENPANFGYHQEATMIRTSGYQQIMTKNTIRYLFGGK